MGDRLHRVDELIDPRLDLWLEGLEARHLSRLRFVEVSRALRALSAAYVERRDRLAHGAALDGGGKRAAFALFYGPLHLLTVRHVVAALPRPPARIDTIVDLGCGTGAAGAGWALAQVTPPRLLGIDRHHWAVTEAAWTYAALGLRGRATQGDVARVHLPWRRTGLLAGYVVNELSDDARRALLARLTMAARRGATILVLEPISRRVAPWWNHWAEVTEHLGGRQDEWRLAAPLPSIVRRLDRAAGLSHEEITARSLWIPGSTVESRAAARDTRQE